MASRRAALVLTCSGKKEGTHNSGTRKRYMPKILGKKARALLRKGRRRAFRGEYKRRRKGGTSIDRKSPRVRALDRYTGKFWNTPRLKPALRKILASGIDCLVFSGGLGLVHLLEPIHDYNASIKTTQKLWRPLLGPILADYLRRQRIDYLYIVCSFAYAQVLRSSQSTWAKELKAVYWLIPYVPRGAGHAYTQVPREEAEAVIALSRTGKPDARWTKERPNRRSPSRPSKMSAKELYNQ